MILDAPENMQWQTIAEGKLKDRWKSHVDRVVLDNLTWESSAGFRLESSNAVQFYARNDRMGLTIPYEYMGIDHAYEPDFLVRLSNGVIAALEIEGYEDD